MKTKGNYKNGQPISEQKGDVLTYYFKTGIVRAKGKSIDGVMQGKWTFNRESGRLWGIGHFKDNQKHGLWVRYDKAGVEEYRAEFVEGKEASKATKSARAKRAASGESRSAPARRSHK